MARVTQLAMKGYRSIRNELEIAFPVDQPLVLVGENNAGKSNIVRTLNLLLGQFSPGFYEPEDHDFCGRDRSVPIHVALMFEEDDPLGGRWTEIHWTYDEANDPAGSFYGVWPGTSKTFISNADRDSCACMLIEADRNLRYHLSYNSKFTFLSRLMRRFHKALMSHGDITKELRDLFEETKGTFKKLPEFQEFVQGLQEGLDSLVSSMTHKLEVDFEAYNPVNFFHALDLHASENGEPRTLDEMGTGEQQVLAMAFAHAYAKAFHTGVLLVIEEPEAHLHPLAQHWLAKRLSKMCADGLQIVIPTHSPIFIDVLNLEGLVLVTKDDDGTSITQLTRDDLVAHCVANGVPEDQIDAENVLPFYAANASREILEGFFAKAIVLVEGPTESLALPVYLQRVGLNTSKEGVAIIPVHGKGNLGKWRRFFDAYGIPCYVVFDNDASSEDKKGARRRDALISVGVVEKDTQDAYIEITDWIIEVEFAVFGSGFEDILRAQFPTYAELEAQGRLAGVDSKPFLARYVAERLPRDNSNGWKSMKQLKQAILALVED